MKRSVALSLAVLLAVPVVAVALQEHQDQQGQERPDYVPSRADEEHLDPDRMPDDVLDFIGIKAGDHVGDMMAAGGYYTWHLAHRVGADGKVYAEKGSNGLQARVEEGDLHGVSDVEIVMDLSTVPAGSLDAVMAVRAYHLIQETQPYLEGIYNALKPGGVVGVIELRIGAPEGHDWDTHRLGEQTVIHDFTAAGFEYVGDSDILRREGDDYSDFRAGERHLADRMLLKFRKPAGN